ncbi:hypothetical protein CPB85DRAFT_1448448 [Mucidula mucida]|nr:hypothetical protein CPB85DRAFT_1448448 [Mucidula mucida]
MKPAPTKLKIDGCYSAVVKKVQRLPEPTFSGGRYSAAIDRTVVWLLGDRRSSFVDSDVEKQVRHPAHLGSVNGREFPVLTVLIPERYWAEIHPDLALGIKASLPGVPDTPPLSLHFDWVMNNADSPAHLTIWSPNVAFSSSSYGYNPSNACPYYPGPYPSDLNPRTGIQSSSLFADGGLGRFDFTQVPQLYSARRPWLSVIVREYESSYAPFKQVLAERISVGRMFMGGERLANRIWPPFVSALLTRNDQLDSSIKALQNVQGEVIRDFWEDRPMYPMNNDIRLLDSLSSFQESVRKVAAIQRGMKEKDMFVQFFMLFPPEGLPAWRKEIISKEEQGRIQQTLPPAEGMCVGCWIYDCDTDMAWFLALVMQTPLYVLQQVDQHPDGVAILTGEEALPHNLAQLNIRNHPHYQLTFPHSWAPEHTPFVYPSSSLGTRLLTAEESIRGSFIDYRDASRRHVQTLIAQAKSARENDERLQPFHFNIHYYIGEMRELVGEQRWVKPPAIC